jgi:chromosome segregation ATPase
MSSLEDLEARVSALEGQMRHVREDAAAARVLAGGADRDVSALASRLDAQTRLLEALRETQVEHGERLAAHDRRFDRLESEMRRGFSTVAQGQAALQRGQEMILDLLRRRNGEEPSTSAE